MAPRLRPRPLFLLAAAAAAGLACDDAQPAFPLADQIAQAFCAHQFDCCAPVEISLLTQDRYTTEAGCVAFATLSAREQLGTVEGAIAQGHITVDPRRAADCVAAYRNAGCNSNTSPQQMGQGLSALPDVGAVLALCPDLLVGHVATGRPCNISQECLHGARCASGASNVIGGGFGGFNGGGVGGTSGSLAPTPGVCLPYQRLGEPCNSSADCDPTKSLACPAPAFVCAPGAQEGEPCTLQFDPFTGVPLSTDCDQTKHLFCDGFGNSVCRRYPVDGEPCANSTFPQCDPDPAMALSCNPFTGVCKKPGNEGAPCGADAIPPCRGDLACNPMQSDGIGQCGTPPALGERCSDRCATPAICDGGFCTMPGTAPVGGPCKTNTDCASLLCGFSSAQQTCSAPILNPVCAGAGITPGLPPGITGFGGTFGTGMGGFGGSSIGTGGFATGFGGRSAVDAGAPGGRAPPPTGTAGAGGSGPIPLGCQFSDPPIGDPFISDFTTDAMGNLSIPLGGTFAYPSPGGPVATATGGAWHITASTMGMPVPQYWGVGIYFNGNFSGTECVDASAHTGVQFDVWGTVDGTGCTLQYSTNDSAHTNNAVDPKGGGDITSYAPQANFTVTATAVTLMMPFTGMGAPTGGSPAIAVDKSKLTGVNWQLTTPADQSCAVDINIDNVRFF